ncbi:MAG: hypothetical protein JNK87_36285 [Bryobacterales bacterium]|nr:hypothetical protein [Bryobacterales bacterium]
MKTARLFLALFGLVLAARLCHRDVIWVEEAYPMAAALEIGRGKVPYRDFWFDKPPLFPWFYALFDGVHGWPLRLAGTLVVLLTAGCAFWLARRFWSSEEGRWAAALTAFFLTFDFPGAVLVVGPDLLTMAPHLLAVFYCLRGDALKAGVACGVALMANAKAPYLLAVCALWQWRSAHRLLAGFVVGALPFVVWLIGAGAWAGYRQQVWDWGVLYSRHALPDADGVKRTLGWAAFHGTLLAGTAWVWIRERGRDTGRQMLWVALAFVAVAAGWRFFPRYYFHLLTPLVILGARGLVAMPPRVRIAALALLLIPALRFGPRYILVAQGKPWADLALHDDSRRAASLVKNASSLLVWGYRPEVYAWSRVPAATPWLDSQPLTGVIADRHLTSSDPVAPELARANRMKLVAYEPQAIVDGLGPMNPALGIDRYPELADWLRRYDVIERTPYSVIYWKRSRTLP